MLLLDLRAKFQLDKPSLFALCSDHYEPLSPKNKVQKVQSCNEVQKVRTFWTLLQLWRLKLSEICCDGCPSTSLLSSAMHSSDDSDWPAHPLMLSFHDLRSLPLRRPPSIVPQSYCVGRYAWTTIACNTWKVMRLLDLFFTGISLWEEFCLQQWA